jgi:rubrerythrin
MAVDFKTSETMKNLMKAFAGESQARNRYTFAAGQAKKENLYVISAIFK